MTGGVDAADFRQGMRQLAAAVSVITTEHEGRRAGMTATSVSSLTADPPQLGVAINRSNASYSAVEGSRRFAVNVLSNDHAEVASCFAGMSGLQGDDRFGAASETWGVLYTGAPVLQGSAASFDCELVQEVPLSSHVLMVGLVRAVRVTPGVAPLLYMDGAWASLVRADSEALDIYEDIIARVDARMQAALATTDHPGKQFASFIEGFAEIQAFEIATLRQFFAQRAVTPAARLDAVETRKRAIERAMVDLLYRGCATGHFDLPNPAIAAQAILGVFGAIHRWPSDPSAKPEDLVEILRTRAVAVAGAAKSTHGA